MHLSLLSEVKKLGLRKDKIDEHWFYYAVVKKRGEMA